MVLYEIRVHEKNMEIYSLESMHRLEEKITISFYVFGRFFESQFFLRQHVINVLASE